MKKLLFSAQVIVSLALLPLVMVLQINHTQGKSNQSTKSRTNAPLKYHFDITIVGLLGHTEIFKKTTNK